MIDLLESTKNEKEKRSNCGEWFPKDKLDYEGTCEECQRFDDCPDDDCVYEDDPCHYVCVECRNGKNYVKKMKKTSNISIEMINFIKKCRKLRCCTENCISCSDFIEIMEKIKKYEINLNLKPLF